MTGYISKKFIKFKITHLNLIHGVLIYYHHLADKTFVLLFYDFDGVSLNLKCTFLTQLIVSFSSL